MPEASKRVLGSASPVEVRAEVIPDSFGYYKCEIANLLLEGEDFKPLTTQIFELNDDSETECSDFRAERLKLTLRQGVFDLAAEVDENVRDVCISNNIREPDLNSGWNANVEQGNREVRITYNFDFMLQE